MDNERQQDRFNQLWPKLEEMFQSTRILKLTWKYGWTSKVSVGVGELKCNEISLLSLDTQFLISKTTFEKTEKNYLALLSQRRLCLNLFLSPKQDERPVLPAVQQVLWKVMTEPCDWDPWTIFGVAVT